MYTMWVHFIHAQQFLIGLIRQQLLAAYNTSCCNLLIIFVSAKRRTKRGISFLLGFLNYNLQLFKLFYFLKSCLRLEVDREIN